MIQDNTINYGIHQRTDGYQLFEAIHVAFYGLVGKIFKISIGFIGDIAPISPYAISMMRLSRFSLQEIRLAPGSQLQEFKQ